MVDRIKEVMEYYEETPAGFSEKLGVSRSNLSHLFSGRNQPSLDFAKKVLTAFPEVSTEWLIMGVGKMIKAPEEMVPVKKEFVQTELFSIAEETEMDDPSPAVSNTKENSTISSVTNVTDVREEEKEVTNVKKIEQLQVDLVNPSENKKNITPISSTSNDAQQAEIKEDNPIERPIVTAPESKIQSPGIPMSERIESQPVNKNTLPSSREKKIEKIIFFYDDDSFKVYHA